MWCALLIPVCVSETDAVVDIIIPCHISSCIAVNSHSARESTFWWSHRQCTEQMAMPHHYSSWLIIIPWFVCTIEKATFWRAKAMARAQNIPHCIRVHPMSKVGRALSPRSATMSVVRSGQNSRNFGEQERTLLRDYGEGAEEGLRIHYSNFIVSHLASPHQNWTWMRSWVPCCK